MDKIDRRKFLKRAFVLGAGTLFMSQGCTGKQQDSRITDQESARNNADSEEKQPAGDAYLGVAKGSGPGITSDPSGITRKAIDAIGGISRFVKRGDDVIIKPNICTDYYSYEYAATTNPFVVGTIVSLCLEAGAKRVRVMDSTMRGSGSSEKAYKISGIKDAVEKAGGIMEIMSPMKFREARIPEGSVIKSWPVYRDILEADVVINVPIPKDHPATELTVGCKNLMGVILNQGKFHDSVLSRRIADLASLVRPALTVVDAVRILIHNGPTGGSLSDVKITNTVIASHDMIAADSYATSLFSLTGNDILHIKHAGEMGLGLTDLSRVSIKEITV
ncbi:MAG: DUF362 domain-containing protein [Spirochaetales bacterium]|nr:DUF362 domain-containing protein [Spirochaetales bacterium]